MLRTSSNNGTPIIMVPQPLAFYDILFLPFIDVAKRAGGISVQDEGLFSNGAVMLSKTVEGTSFSESSLAPSIWLAKFPVCFF